MSYGHLSPLHGSSCLTQVKLLQSSVVVQLNTASLTEVPMRNSR